MKYVLIFLTLLIAEEAFSKEYRLLQADRLDVEYTRLDAKNRDPYAPQYTGLWRERAALKWDLSSYDTLYWRNNVHMETIANGGVPKTVGWEWEAGFKLFKDYEIFHHHHSRHIMEESPEPKRFEAVGQFPVEDGYGIRFKFLTK